jgi:VIT1/CCC1 family predicted Fe2+/Mn2+ transporter
MKRSLRVGFSFGLTSGVITTLGLIVGLDAGTNSRLAVIGGIITIAIADTFSDALGIHVSQESENEHSQKEVWESTLSTFLSKFIFALTFLIPILIFKLSTGVIISVIWGLLLLIILNYNIARREKINPIKVIKEHLLIAIIVIILTYFIGKLIASIFV